MRVGIFGGSFDPPHVAHVGAALSVLGTGEIDRVLVLPVFEHAFGKPLAPFADRVAMTELAMAGNSGVEVSALEESLGAPSRTLGTLEHLRAIHPDWVCRLVVGADVLAETEKWHRFDDVVRLAPLLVLGRIGVNRNDAPTPTLPDVSSTDVRRRIAGVNGKAADDPELLRRVPRTVLDYIDAHGLYR